MYDILFTEYTTLDNSHIRYASIIYRILHFLSEHEFKKKKNLFNLEYKTKFVLKMNFYNKFNLFYNEML